MRGVLQQPGNKNPLAFLAGGGEMGERTRSFDWSSTPVGPLASWPQSLKTLVRTMLDSRYAMWLGWGPDFTFFYNDAYARMTLGPKHPWALGRSAREVWSEIWTDIGPRAESVIRTGQATWDEGLLLFLERQGFPEETYHTFSYSPVPDDAGGVGGMLCVVTEDTERTIGERRLRTLRELAARTNDVAKSVEEACDTAVRTLIGNPHDLPFVALYLLNNDSQSARLVGLAGLDPNSPVCPAKVELEHSLWPFRQVAESGTPVIVDDIRKRFGPLPRGEWPEPTVRAVVLPMAKPGQARPTGFVVSGISPRLVYSDGYRGFLDLLAGHIATAVANARAYEEERQRAEKLAELDRAKTAFFSNVSHEFRTPLTLMLGPVEDILAKPVEQVLPDNRQLLEVIHRNGRRLQRLVNSLLDFSRIEAGRVRAVFEPTDLAALTADLASNFRSACDKAGLDLLVECPPLPEPVFVDSAMWEKIVLNLLSNAFKFTFKGQIAVKLRPVDRTAELRVIDTGIGIPSNEMPRLFERFHRVENAHGRTHEGSGIGLALVHELVKLHGGSIHAASELELGTTFIVSIPLGSNHLPPEQVGAGQSTAPIMSGASPFVEEALRWLPDDRGETGSQAHLPSFDDEPLLPAIAIPPGNCDRPRVLVADDNADMRRYVERLLGGRYEIETVADGEEALRSVKRQAPELILSDVMMPRLDGFGLLKELRGDPRTASVPVILLSARAGEESRVEGMEAGADDYLVKPFSAKELQARVGAQVQMARLRRDSDRAIRESEERFRALVNASSDMVYSMNPDWTEMRFLVGRKVIADTQAPSRSWLQKYIHPDDQSRVTEAIQIAVQTKDVYELEHRVLQVDGSLGWTFSRAVPLLDAQGNVLEWFGMATDITARKQAEQALQDSEAHFRSMADNAPTMLWVTDPSGACTYLSRQWFEFTGRTPEQDMGFGWLENVHPDDSLEAGKVFRTACENQAPFAIDYRLRRRDGKYRWASDVGLPRFEGGIFKGFVGNVTEVHERKLAEEQSAEAHQFLHSSIDALSSHIAVLDENGVILAVNDAWSRFAELNQKTSHNFGIGSNYVEECKHNRGDCVEHGMAAEGLIDVLYQRKDYFELEYPCHSPTENRWFVMRATRFRSPGPVRVVVAHEDVTKRKSAEDGLLEADRRKDEFLATLAHELRNPLAPIRNGLQILRLSGGEGSAVEPARAMMERQLGQLVHLVDDLLDLSRISRGKIELRTTRVELLRIVQQAVETSRPLIEANSHDLEITVPPGPIFVEVDTTRMTQVFSNLLNNAAKYTERGGRIRVAVQRRGTEVTVSVKDNGLGIPSHMLPRVFEMFTQVDRNLDRSQGGLGIGLSIVKRLVEMHGGSVGVESAGSGMGSEFMVRLPVAHKIPQTSNDDESDPPLTRRQILVVDDNVDAAMSLAMMLELMGNETKTAHDGLEALEIVTTYRPDLVLLDIGMPKLNGHETAKRIRELPWGKDVVLVALTGWGQEEDRRRSEQAGFDAHITKPIEPAALERLLANLKVKKA